MPVDGSSYMWSFTLSGIVSTQTLEGLKTQRLETRLGLVFWDLWTIIMFSFSGVLILRKLWNVWWAQCDSFFCLTVTMVTILHIRCGPRGLTHYCLGWRLCCCTIWLHLVIKTSNRMAPTTWALTASLQSKNQRCWITTSDFIRHLNTHLDSSVTLAHMDS